MQFSLKLQKNETSQVPSSALHLEGLAGNFRHRYSVKLFTSKWIQKLLNSTNIFWKDLMLYWLNLILNFKLGLVLFRQIQIIRSTRHKNFQKQSKRIFYTVALSLPTFHQQQIYYSHVYRKKFWTAHHSKSTY